MGADWDSLSSQESCWSLLGQSPLVLVRCESLLCRDKVLSAGSLYVSGRGKFPWGLKEHRVLSISRDIMETRQCSSAEDLGAGSSCALL